MIDMRIHYVRDVDCEYYTICGVSSFDANKTHDIFEVDCNDCLNKLKEHIIFT